MVVAPDEVGTIEVVVEIPRGSRNKYEYEHGEHALYLDRRLFTATSYPAEYGFVPDTLAEDGDPLDVVVVVAEPTFPGCHIRAVPLGLLTMADDQGPDHKVIAVPSYTVAPGQASLDLLDPDLLAEIRHFFDVYKDLEGKETVVGGYLDAEEAQVEIATSRRRFADRPAAGPART